MSDDQREKSGLSPRSKTSRRSYKRASKGVNSLLLTLKRAVNRSHVLASLQEQTLLLWFRSMTKEQRAEAIGLLRQMKDDVGASYVKCLRIDQSLKSSRTGSMTFPSSFDLTESERWGHRRILSY